jgi:hypothetical protein
VIEYYSIVDYYYIFCFQEFVKAVEAWRNANKAGGNTSANNNAPNTAVSQTPRSISVGEIATSSTNTMMTTNAGTTALLAQSLASKLEEERVHAMRLIQLQKEEAQMRLTQVNFK